MIFFAKDDYNIATMDENKTVCLHCNRAIPTSRFCPECGKSQQQQHNICRKCSSSVTQGARFCSNCGESQVENIKKCVCGAIVSGKFCMECGKKFEGSGAVSCGNSQVVAGEPPVDPVSSSQPPKSMVKPSSPVTSGAYIISSIDTSAAAPTDMSATIPTDTTTAAPTNTKTPAPTDISATPPTGPSAPEPTDKITAAHIESNTTVPTDASKAAPTDISSPTDTNIAATSYRSTQTATCVSNNTNATVPNNSCSSLPTDIINSANSNASPTAPINLDKTEHINQNTDVPNQISTSVLSEDCANITIDICAHPPSAENTLVTNDSTTPDQPVPIVISDETDMFEISHIENIPEQSDTSDEMEAQSTSVLTRAGFKRAIETQAAIDGTKRWRSEDGLHSLEYDYKTGLASQGTIETRMEVLKLSGVTDDEVERVDTQTDDVKIRGWSSGSSSDDIYVEDDKTRQENSRSVQHDIKTGEVSTNNNQQDGNQQTHRDSQTRHDGACTQQCNMQTSKDDALNNDQQNNQETPEDKQTKPDDIQTTKEITADNSEQENNQQVPENDETKQDDSRVEQRIGLTTTDDCADNNENRNKSREPDDDKNKQGDSQTKQHDIKTDEDGGENNSSEQNKQRPKDGAKVDDAIASVEGHATQDASKEANSSEAENVNSHGYNSVFGGANKDTSDSITEYRKPDEPEQYVPAKDSKHNYNTRGSKKKDTSTKKIKVIFQAVVSSTFEFDSSKNKVELRFDHAHLGGWNGNTETKWICHVTEILPNNMFMVKCVVPIKFEILERGVNYKYVVMGKKQKEQGFHEYVFRNKTENKNIEKNRHLKIDAAVLTTKDAWVQCDGVIRTRPKKGIKEWFQSFFKGSAVYETTTYENRTAINLMMPGWRGLSERGDQYETAEEAIDHIWNMYQNSKRWMVDVHENPGDDQLFRECLWKLVSDRLSLLSTSSLAEWETGMYLASALTILWIIQKFHLGFSTESKQVLCNTLLPLQDDATRIRCEIEGLSKYFENSRLSEIGDMLCELVRTMVNRGTMGVVFSTPEWLYALPAIHFLKGTDTPGQKFVKDSNHRVEVWWGITPINAIVNDFIDWAHFYGYYTLKPHLLRLVPYFTTDEMLPRSILAVLPADVVLEAVLEINFPIEAVMANLFYWFNMKGDRIEYKRVRDVLGKLDKQLSAQVGIDKNDLTEIDFIIALDFVESVCNRIKTNYEYPVVVAALRVVAKIGSICATETKDRKSELWEKLFKICRDWIDCRHNFVINTNFVSASDISKTKGAEMIEEMYDLDIPAPDLERKWKSFTVGLLQNMIDKLDPVKKLVLYCHGENLLAIHPDIAQCVREAAFQNIDFALEARDIGLLFESSHGNDNKQKFGEVLSQLFSKRCPTVVSTAQPSDTIHFMLISQEFTKFLKLYCEQNQHLSILQYQVRTNLEKCVMILKQLIDGIQTRHIVISHLDLILSHNDTFGVLLDIMSTESRSAPPDEVMGALASLQGEYEQFKTLRKRTSDFLTLCALVKDFADTKELERENSHNLNQTYVDKSWRKMRGSDGIVVNYIPENLAPILAGVEKYFQSASFRRIWENKAKELHHAVTFSGVIKKVDLDDVVGRLWPQVQQLFRNLGNILKSGNILFGEVETYFGEFKTNKNNLRCELVRIEKMMGQAKDKNSWASRRTDQIEQYFTLGQYRQGAQVILKLKGALKVDGDFSTLNIILQSGQNKHARLRELDMNLLKIAKHILHIDDDKTRCLTVLAESMDLVKWLRQNVRGVKEVKVLADLAMMSAIGQGDKEVEKASCLLKATTGYAPLIFDMEGEMDFREFIDRCAQVWNILKEEPKLPEQLKVTRECLDWLKHVNESHGSVEVNAIEQAKAINSRGIIKIGNFSKLEGTELLEDNTIEIMVLPDESSKQRETLTYTIEKLRDLQSVLVLVAGQVEEVQQHVQKFEEIYDGVTRICHQYLQLHSSGNILFNEWHVIFYCNQSRPLRAEVDFGLERVDLLRDTSGEDYTLRERLLGVADFLDECYTGWMEEIAKLRTQYYFMNYFTTEQLVLLRQYLAKFQNHQGDVLKEMCPLLESVKTHCTGEDIQIALATAHALFVAMDASQTDVTHNAAISHVNHDDDINVNNDDVTMSDVTEQPTLDKEKNELVIGLVDVGVNQNVAHEAIFQYGYNFEDALIWCMDQPQEETDASMHNRESITNTQDDYIFGQRGQGLADVTRELMKHAQQQKCLKDMLLELWYNFRKQIHKDLRDYISVDHIGLFLEELAGTDTSITRSLPDYLKPGKPNLIVCQPGEVFYRLLAVYADSADNHQTLPTPQEVLLCTPHTRLEEVELLWRRTMGFHGLDKIFSLVNAHLLDYTLAREALNTLAKLSNGDYKVIIICSDDKSQFVSALEQHRVQNIPLRNLPPVNMFIQKQVREVRNTVQRCQPLSKLDPERCTVRVVKSDRAGCGKTLRIKRMSQNLKPGQHITISIHNRVVNNSYVLSELCKHLTDPAHPVPRIVHLDVAQEVEEGLDELLFNLLVLGYLTDHTGRVWVKRPYDLYVVETLPLLQINKDKLQRRRETSHKLVHHMLDILPTLRCWSPIDSLNIMTGDEVPVHYNQNLDQTFDQTEYTSSVYQTPFTYLSMYMAEDTQHSDENDLVKCLRVILRHCGIKDPSWVELRHYVCFLNTQLEDCQYSAYCSDALSDDLPGFEQFIVKFMVQMSKDFATRSLEISESTPGYQPEQKELDMYLEEENDEEIIDEPEEGVQDSEDEEEEMNDDNSDEDGIDYQQMGAPQAVRFMFADDVQNEAVIPGQMPADFVIPGDIMVTGQDGNQEEEANDDWLRKFQLKRRWETSPHPYVFFNQDRDTFTFLGFNIERTTRNVIDTVTGRVLVENIMSEKLNQALHVHGVNMTENFDDLSREEKLLKLCRVMGTVSQSGEILIPFDDPSYELTTDNVKKMLAIYMRFRCGIPVIIMGETGCGKTRLVEYMCNLKKPVGEHVRNMVIVKVHGGTTANDITRKVEEASQLALENMNTYGIETVLFFDEANTTEAIGIIKEIICDKTLHGKVVKGLQRLKFVAAVNPYRKHSEEMITKLEEAGLGYHMKADETTDRLGRIPMRRLVYRVHPLPQSMIPLVWDFGQLNTQTELLYIRQIVKKFLEGDKLDLDREDKFTKDACEDTISRVLSTCQQFMRRQQDECSFVSLRDIDRLLKVMDWFYKQDLLFREIDKLKSGDQRGMEEYENEYEVDEEEEIIEEDENTVEHPDDVPIFVQAHRPIVRKMNNRTRSLILAVAVCYQSCLQASEHRLNLRRELAEELDGLVPHPVEQNIQTEIDLCQEVFLNQVDLGPNIAKNQALKENVFMMIICIELGIPLFLVGKPGSSKSLARTIVSDAMQGTSSKLPLFKTLKKVQMMAFQCSPLATPEGIVGTFAKCAQLQKASEDRHKFVAVVVLDEVGLAEDSPKMPLKTLHPLLEEGYRDEEDGTYYKVGFIGISNWALDPAKMNRGILVQRCVPDDEELLQSAMGICTTEGGVLNHILPLLKPLAEGYLEFCKPIKEFREFYGLRDFYSLIKMVYNFAARNNGPPTWGQLEHAIRRNFDGLRQKDQVINPVEVFGRKLNWKISQSQPSDPVNTPHGLIDSSLKGDNLELHSGKESPSRFLLLMSENNSALAILEEHMNLDDPKILYGSSFPRDQEYTQICRNINRIRNYMAVGKTVILINTDNLYESLYDVLNQYYETMGGNLFVDIGLGSHRVKCKIHKDFRLVVVAEQDHVYKQFPIPLINRLEKHFLSMSTLLNAEQTGVVKQLETWAQQFVKSNSRHMLHNVERREISKGDVFIGYHRDAVASVVLHMWKQHSQDTHKLIECVKERLLQCATPESVLRLSHTQLKDTESHIRDLYFMKQTHGSLKQLVTMEIRNANDRMEAVFLQVTTHSRLLSRDDVTSMCPDINTTEMGLQEFATELEFCKELQNAFDSDKETLLVIQCGDGHIHAELIACSRYYLLNEYDKAIERRHATSGRIHIVFVIQLPRIAGGCFIGFQGGRWNCYHVDDLSCQSDSTPPIASLHGHKVSSLLKKALNTPEVQQNKAERNLAMETIEEELGNTIDMEDNGIFNSQDVEMAMEDDGDEFNLDENMEDMMEGEDMDETSRMLRQLESGVFPQIQDGMDVDEQETDNNIRDRNDARNLKSIGDRGFTRDRAEARDRDIDESKDGADITDNIPTLDLRSLLVGLIHAAVSVIEDHPGVDRNRKTERVARIKNILDNADNPMEHKFFHVLCQRLADMYTEKENAQPDPANWLCNEVANMGAVINAGTLRRSLETRLDTKLTPVLSTLIAYMDSDYNMDLLFKPKYPWIASLWLQMLESTDVTPIHVLDNTDNERVVITTHGCGEMPIVTQFPFSWVIKDTLDALIHKAKPVQDLPLVETIENLFNNSTLGRIIQANVPSIDTHRAVEMYLDDLVRMVYKPSSGDGKQHEMEYLMVKRCISLTAHELFSDSTLAEYIPTIVHVHLAYTYIRHRIHNFSLIVNGIDGIVNKLWEYSINETKTLSRTAESIREMNKSPRMTLDLQTLLLLLHSLTPADDGKVLQTSAGRGRWIERVQKCQSLIVRTLHDIVENTGLRDGHQEIIHGIKNHWRIMTCVYLFVEHVGNIGNTDTMATFEPHFYTLWKYLEKLDNVDFKCDKTIQQIEQYLRSCNIGASRKLFGQKHHNCVRCTFPMSYPVRLPCKHIVCQRCAEEQIEVTGYVMCVECNIQHVLKRVTPIENMKAASNNMETYRNRCNSFFMDLVSRLCFEGFTPPEPDLVQRLLKYITKRPEPGSDGDHHGIRTKRFTIHDDGIDPTPVVRLFLLQLLLRYNFHDVRQHLEEYFGQIRHITQDEQHTLMISQLIINCFEDSYDTLAPSHDTIPETRNRLRRAKTALHHTGINIEKLECIGQIRHGLRIVAEYMYKQYIERDTSAMLTRQDNVEIRKLIDAAADVCDNTQCIWPRLFLLKQICRRYGMNALKQLATHQPLRWIITQQDRDEQARVRPDRYIIYGDTYKTVRSALAEVLLGRDVNTLDELFKDKSMDDRQTNERLLSLAIYREITILFSERDNQKRVPHKIATALAEFIRNNEFLNNKDYLIQLITNNLGNHGNIPELITTPELNPGHMAMLELLVHFRSNIPNMGGHLWRPLMDIMQRPGDMATAYFPTMPEDHVQEIREALLDGRNQTRRRLADRDHNPVLFSCPNGHPYIVGHCGRPVDRARCHDCGALIGGQNHTPDAGNTTIRDSGDQTRSGHILGPASERSKVGAPERNLSVTSLLVMRLLTHMSMYTAAGIHPQEVGDLMSPRIDGNNVSQELWQHMQIDMEMLSTSQNIPLDDCYVIIHSVLLYNTQHTQGDERVDNSLKSKQSRRNWETAFNDAHLRPRLENLHRHIQEANQKIANDDRMGDTGLLRTIYEVDNDSTALNIHNLHQSPAVWRYRHKISVQHFKHKFTNTHDQLKDNNDEYNVVYVDLMKLFLEKEHELCLLRHLPGIVKLVNMLTRRYYGNIDKSKAEYLTLEEVVTKLPQGLAQDECRILIGQFTEAWEAVRERLGHFVFHRRLSVPQNICERRITMGTKLAYLLPSMRGSGLCALGLLAYLVQIENDFLEEYSRLRKQSLTTEVRLRDVTSSHVISYVTEDDLLPIILAHCNYTFDVQQSSSSSEYKYIDVMRQIEERFIMGKPRIKFESDLMLYRTELTTKAMFDQLENRITQVLVDSSLRQDIIRECKRHEAIADTLASIDVTIGFLVSIGNPSDVTIHEFITQTLRKDTVFCSQKAAQHCKLEHIKALWLILSQTRAQLLTIFGQDAFDSIDDKYKSTLTPEQIRDLHRSLNHVNTELFLQILYECIILQITVALNQDDEDYVDNVNFPLDAILAEYTETELPTLPNTITAEHSVAVWCEVYKQSIRHGQQYRY